MGFLAWLGPLISGFFNSILRTFLGGLFNQTITQANDEAQHKLDEAQLQAQTTNDSAAVEIQVVQDQSEVKDHYQQMPPMGPTGDPFNNADWNKGSD